MKIFSGKFYILIFLVIPFVYLFHINRTKNKNLTILLNFTIKVFKTSAGFDKKTCNPNFLVISITSDLNLREVKINWMENKNFSKTKVSFVKHRSVWEPPFSLARYSQKTIGIDFYLNHNF